MLCCWIVGDGMNGDGEKCLYASINLSCSKGCSIEVLWGGCGGVGINIFGVGLR